MIRRIAAPALAALTLAASTAMPLAAGAQPNLKAFEQAAEKRFVTAWEECFFNERFNQQQSFLGACLNNLIQRLGR